MTTKGAPPSSPSRRVNAITHSFVCMAIVCLSLASSLRAQSSSSAASNPQDEPTILELGKPIDREMYGADTHVYKVHVEAGQFMHVVVLQEGIDVVVGLLDPTGKQFVTYDSLNGSYGPEPVSMIAASSGDVRVSVISGSSGAAPGKYRIQLTDLRAPVEADRTRIKAERTYMEGVDLSSQADAKSQNAAMAKWHESFTLWQSLDDKYGEALSLCGVGGIYGALKENQKALDFYNQALPLERAVMDRSGEAATLTNIGVIYKVLGEKQKALDFYNQALPLERAVGDRMSEA